MPCKDDAALINWVTNDAELTRTLLDVLTEAETDDIVAGTKVYPLLAAMPGVGKVKAMRLMEDCKIAENRKIRGLGSRQRECLLDHFS